MRLPFKGKIFWAKTNLSHNRPNINKLRDHFSIWAKKWAKVPAPDDSFLLFHSRPARASTPCSEQRSCLPQAKKASEYKQKKTSLPLGILSSSAAGRLQLKAGRS
jgi:hypothetical protein